MQKKGTKFKKDFGTAMRICDVKSTVLLLLILALTFTDDADMLVVGVVCFLNI